MSETHYLGIGYRWIHYRIMAVKMLYVIDRSDMFSQVSWLRPVDIAILEILGSPLKLALNPAAIAKNIDYSPNYVGQRTELLFECGLLTIDEESGPYYSITDLGEEVLDREIDPAELEKLGPDR
ncbi:hypothetical protein [Saliphagus infecundisoli]|uniref:Phage PhiH1 repressor protein n=1 Tax=Saliphagus infecundisoli TaxID=1849069 RepID=A0ABD5QKT9_9EURY|nr:hypothetical protein [Saliphagus infecundisoli]